jgi:hypothetical protein
MAAENLIRVDHNREEKKFSNKNWMSEADPQIRIGTMKERKPYLACKRDRNTRQL